MASPLKMHLNLQQLAMIQVAINCWEQGDVKSEIKEFFLANPYRNNFEKIEGKLDEWSKNVVERFRDDVNLPDTIKHQMISMISSVGHRMIHWLAHKSERPMFDYYLDNIFWTSCGTIDEVKIFEMLYCNQTIVDLTYIFEEACCLCLEDYVNNVWDKLSEDEASLIHMKEDDLAEDVPYIDCIEEFNVYLFLYWMKPARNSHVFSETGLPTNFEKVYDFNKSVQLNSFVLSVHAGYEAAAKYFYNQLSYDEKREKLVELASALVEDISAHIPHFTPCCGSRYFNLKYADILVFLLREMSDSQQQNFMEKYAFRVLEILLRTWPWQNLFIPMVKKFSGHLYVTDYRGLIRTVIEDILDETEDRNEVKHYPIYEILLQLWNEAPASVRKDMTEYSKLFAAFVSKMDDVSFLEYIINDPDLVSERKNIMKNLEDFFLYLLIAERYDLVDSILRKVFLYTEEQCVNFKKKYDSLWVCKCFVYNNNFDGLDDFLEWQFESTEEADYFKNHIKFNLCCYTLCAVWKCHDLKLSQTVSEEMFAYFMYDENDKKNLREQLVSSDDFGSTLRCLARSGESEKFEEFLNCCEFPEEDVDILKLIFPIKSTV